MPPALQLRPALLSDVPLLRRWDKQPHLQTTLGGDDWQWETSLALPSPAHRPLIAELEGRAVGFLEILDPSQDPERYWGDLPPGCRAIDLWIGEPEDLGKGTGTAMMREALVICFADPEVHTVLVDPLASNASAHKFYEQCGFRFVKQRKFGKDDCFVFQKQRTGQGGLE